MLNVFVPQPQGLARVDPGSPASIPDNAVWIDLLEPTVEEEKFVEATLGVDVPTREEMREIETSNRLYEDNGALYMTTTVAAQLDTDRPVSMQVTFILVGQRLVTNRYLDTKPFQQFISYAERHPAACQNPLSIPYHGNRTSPTPPTPHHSAIVRLDRINGSQEIGSRNLRPSTSSG